MTALNPMLTLVAVPCLRCGSTAETVKRDRQTLEDGGAVCCAPPLECWFCGADARQPYCVGYRAFCCRACAGDWAE